MLLHDLPENRGRWRFRHQSRWPVEEPEHQKGKRSIGVYRAEICDDDGENCETSSGERNFCKHCGTALWLFDPRWPELIHPFASAIDTDLPKPKSKVHLMLRYKANWVKPQIGRNDERYELYPKLSLEAWHKKHKAWVK